MLRGSSCGISLLHSDVDCWSTHLFSRDVSSDARHTASARVESSSFHSLLITKSLLMRHSSRQRSRAHTRRGAKKVAREWNN
jgi:hypothetical protein